MITIALSAGSSERGGGVASLKTPLSGEGSILLQNRLKLG
jgi:hypothetical protein